MSRMPRERLERARQQLEEISESDYAKVKGLAEIVKPLRSFIHKTPDDHGLTDWSDIYFQSDDGVSLEGWYIPAKGGESDKLVIFNHALPMCRSGFPGHFGPPWSGFDAVEIDFVLHEPTSGSGASLLPWTSILLRRPTSVVHAVGAPQIDVTFETKTPGTHQVSPGTYTIFFHCMNQDGEPEKGFKGGRLRIQIP